MTWWLYHGTSVSANAVENMPRDFGLIVFHVLIYAMEIVL